jgi:uncharacterized protein
MANSLLYHDGNHALQDALGTRKLAERMETTITRTEFSDSDRAFIEGALFFFLATADADGRPDCSFKGGMPGFVRITGAGELTFPSYDGNGMFKSLGNIRANPAIGMLFIDMGDSPRRLRVNGDATLVLDGPALRDWDGAQALVRVTTRVIFPNCPRYIPKGAEHAPSEYAPRPGYVPPQPAWKGFDAFKDVVPTAETSPRRGEA